MTSVNPPPSIFAYIAAGFPFFRGRVVDAWREDFDAQKEESKLCVSPVEYDKFRSFERDRRHFVNNLSDSLILIGFCAFAFPVSIWVFFGPLRISWALFVVFEFSLIVSLSIPGFIHDRSVYKALIAAREASFTPSDDGESFNDRLLRMSALYPWIKAQDLMQSDQQLAQHDRYARCFQLAKWDYIPTKGRVNRKLVDISKTFFVNDPDVFCRSPLNENTLYCPPSPEKILSNPEAHVAFCRLLLNDDPRAYAVLFHPSTPGVVLASAIAA
jgi:hypothetical protein